jgi:hypothetical protein
MQHAGDPTLNWEALLPYDFPGLAGAVDIWEPEPTAASATGTG